MTSAREDCGMNAIIFRLISQQHSSSLLMKGISRLQHTKLEVLCRVQKWSDPGKKRSDCSSPRHTRCTYFLLKADKEFSIKSIVQPST